MFFGLAQAYYHLSYSVVLKPRGRYLVSSRYVRAICAHILHKRSAHHGVARFYTHDNQLDQILF
jgi:hypothetical protein